MTACRTRCILIFMMVLLVVPGWPGGTLLAEQGAEEHHDVAGEPTDARPQRLAEVSVEQVGTFSFDPTEVETARPDLFQPGHFSLFDVLLHLHQQGFFAMEYAFDETMNTFVIESLAGQEGWWYDAYYDGGWPERSVFRMDHYSYKDGMTLAFNRRRAGQLEAIYETYGREVDRRADNDGAVVISEVIIEGASFRETFRDVEVQAHNLREDVFREGTVTAIDVILTLGEAGLLDYGLQWYESMGSADIVKSYWVDRINEDQSHGRCGFVYEAGDQEFRFFGGNHNHIPSDVRPLNSPQYLTYFWICI